MSASPPNGTSNGAAKEDPLDLDAANLEPIDKRKMFVGGLSLDTEEDDLKDHFAQYGTVMHCVVKRDPMNGRSRCFGFVTFTSSSAIKKVHEISSHMIKGRRIDPKPAEPRQNDGSDGIMKVFVGGLDSQMDDDDLKAYFEKFGTVLKLEWPRDRMRNNQKKNFAFVEFDNERVVNDVVRNAKQEIGGRMCDVRKAIPPAQKTQQQAGMGGGMGMGMGMGGGGGGGNMDRNSGWGDFGGGGQGGFGGGGFGNPYADPYAAAYGGFGAEQMAAYYAAQGYDPSAFFADPSSMAAYYGGAGGYDFGGAAGYDYTGGFAAAAAAAGYAGYGGGMGGGDGMRGAMRGAMRGSSGGDSNTSPRGGSFGGVQKSGFGGSSGGSSSAGGRGGSGGGGTRGGYHPYRR